MDFGEIITSSWKIIWKHKVLWLFGFLSIIGLVPWTISAYAVNYLFSFAILSPTFEPVFTQLEDLPDWQFPKILVIIGLLIILWLVITFIITIISKIGVVHGTKLGDTNPPRLAFGELLRGSLPYFWRVFGLYLLIALAGLLFFGLLFFIGIALATTTDGIGLLCLIPIFCLLIPAGIIVNTIIEQATVAIVIEDLGISAGFARGWKVIKSNPGTYILMWLILTLGVQGIIGQLIASPLQLIGIPNMFETIISSGTFLSGMMSFFGLVLCVFIPIYFLLYSILQAYVGAAWTLTFLRVTGKAETT